jgi:serine O-acetyltransferase
MMASFLSWTIRHAYSCSIAPTARLGGGLILPHPVGIVIGPGVEVGPRAWIFQHSTLGGSPGREGMPRVGPDARIYPGAVLAGPIEVGANVVIGANAVVTVDVPDRTLVRSPSPAFSPIADHFRVDS